MTCEEVRALLAEGSQLPPEAAAHLAACQKCRAAAQRWAALRREFAAFAAEPEPPFLHQRIMAAVRQAAAQPLPWWRRVPRAAWASAGVAVALVVGVLATQGVLRPGGVQRWAREELTPQVAPPAHVVAEPREQPWLEPVAKTVARPGEDSAGAEATASAPVAPAPEVSGPAVKLPATTQGGSGEREQLAQVVLVPTPPSQGVVGVDTQPVAEVAAVAAAAPVGREGARPAGVREGKAAAPPWRLQEMAAAPPPPTKIRVVLLAASGEEALALWLAEAMAPPPAQLWSVVVGEDGRVALEGPPPNALGELQPVWERALADAHLPPGRYRVVRPRP